MNEKINKKFETKDIVLLGLFLALRIILGRFLAFDVGILRITFAFVVTALVGYLYGPTVTMGFGILGDFLGYWLFPQSFAYFPGYTLSAGIAGFFYGFLLYNKKYKSTSSKTFLFGIIGATTISCVFCNLILNTVWTSILYDKGFMALLPSRAIKNISFIPVETIILCFMFALLRVPLKRLKSSV